MKSKKWPVFVKLAPFGASRSSATCSSSGVALAASLKQPIASLDEHTIGVDTLPYDNVDTVARSPAPTEISRLPASSVRLLTVRATGSATKGSTFS
jgi:hypothetical protein